MKKFEYRVLHYSVEVAFDMTSFDEITDHIEAKMNKAGQKGWELIQWRDDLMFFKREIPEEEQV